DDDRACEETRRRQCRADQARRLASPRAHRAGGHRADGALSGERRVAPGDRASPAGRQRRDDLVKLIQSPCPALCRAPRSSVPLSFKAGVAGTRLATGFWNYRLRDHIRTTQRLEAEAMSEQPKAIDWKTQGIKVIPGSQLDPN